ncbi:AzlD domain-containing protein [Sulfitobacter aestuariivivens]|uniref:AzlD domain-containing protein n=1 Tax=Sulfitobacter aestuariivivens TaxID=2766981 RepID=A0A927D6J5_9RHOB|nr:AzlD domain-containing protein [Sulfitobacter aestuariivivens]MBD3664427.1 AzlD domain-containing protein [Sulfitobacter aestuariivivens]
MIDTAILWIVIIALGMGSFMLRFSFLGFVGARNMPAWLLRHLRYTAVAILPALVAPQVFWPAATDGQLDPARLAAAAVTLSVGVMTKNAVAAILAGAGVLFALLNLL